MTHHSRSLWHRVFARYLPTRPPAPAKRPARARLSLETLEGRIVLSTLTVTSVADDNGAGTLRAQVAQASADAARGLSDNVVFSPALSGKTVTLTQGELLLGAPGTGTVTVDGGSRMTVNGNNAGRVFEVASGVNAVLNGLTITGGKTDGRHGGAGILNAGTLTISNSTVTNNDSGDSGGGVLNTGSLTVNHSTLSQNHSATNGGGIENFAGTLGVSDTTLVGNSAGNSDFGASGGAISNEGNATLTVDRSTLAQNSSTGFGGGIDNLGRASVSNTTLAGNFAKGNGGGVENELNSAHSSRMTVSNSTVSGNFSGNTGGGIHDEGLLTVSNSTVSGNVAATQGGGIGGVIDPAHLLSTLVAGNNAPSGPDIAGTATGSFNLVGNGDGMTGITGGAAGNQVGTGARPINPLLGPLADNGGPTRTMALRPGSPAYNTGGPLSSLQGALSTSATTVPVADASFAATPGRYVLAIGNEQILVTGVDAGGTQLTVERGFNGTSAAAHPSGQGVFFAADQRGQSRVVGGHTSVGAFQNQVNPSPEVATAGIARGESGQPALSGVGFGPTQARQGVSPSLASSPGESTALSGQPALGSGGSASFTLPAGFSPTQIRKAYGFDQITFDGGRVAGDGAGQTIAIVDAFHDPNLASDLHQFDLTFGIADPPSFSVDTTLNPQGTLANWQWGSEAAMDVEWAHAIAPKANIVLVESPDSSRFSERIAAGYAAGLKGVSVVSMSFGDPEGPGDAGSGNMPTQPGHQGVTFVASAGDNGVVESPSVLPNVLAVGGTQLSTDGLGNFAGETAWTQGGGGISSRVSEPGFQRGVQSTGFRSVPDVAFNAGSNTDGAGNIIDKANSHGFLVYNTWMANPATPLFAGGGTSAGAPQWAALVAIANQGRSLQGLGSLDGASQTLPTLYKLPASDFHDITTGSTLTGHEAHAGFDQATGLGSPVANRVVADLANAPAGEASAPQRVEASATLAQGDVAAANARLDALDSIFATMPLRG